MYVRGRTGDEGQWSSSLVAFPFYQQNQNDECRRKKNVISMVTFRKQETSTKRKENASKIANAEFEVVSGQ